jgi:hypothetical protein
VHVAAALTAREGRFLAAAAGNTTHAASIPVMASLTIRMISSQFQRHSFISAWTFPAQTKSADSANAAVITFFMCLSTLVVLLF